MLHSILLHYDMILYNIIHNCIILFCSCLSIPLACPCLVTSQHISQRPSKQTDFQRLLYSLLEYIPTLINKDAFKHTENLSLKAN